MFEANKLVENGYLPIELPPCFTVKSISENYESIKGWVSGVKKNVSVPLIYNGFKNINARRRFAIPNIYHYIKTVQCIVKYNDDIFKILNKSTASLSKPVDGDVIPDNEPYKKASYKINDTKENIEKLYQDNLFEIKLDINSCFYNIYTHAIPWAMHGKEIAKKSNGKLSGDKIDECFRSMNYGQTNGILIGNAASRIISEIILCNIDQNIQDNFENIRYCRFVDDYFIFLKDSSQIQNIISFVRNELSKYELSINENKLQIIESPFVYDKEWVGEIQLFIHLDGELFLNKVIYLYTKYKDNSILRYAFRVLYLQNIKNMYWKSIESKIINLWVTAPINSDLILEILLDKKECISKNNIKFGIYSILDKCIPLDHDIETTWAVWFIKIFNIKINKEYVRKILESKNSLAIIILLDIIYSNQKVYPLQTYKEDIIELTTELQSYDTDNSGNIKNSNLMWSKYWLLVYEADLNKWFNIGNFKFEYARKNDFFKNLIKNNICFYDKQFKYKHIKDKENLQYITKADFLKYTTKINELINKTLKSKKDRDKYLKDIKSIEEKFTERIYRETSSY